MIILAVCTLFFQVFINSSFKPLITALPLNLAIKLNEDDLEGTLLTSKGREQFDKVTKILNPLAKVKDVGDKSVARLKEAAGDAVLRNPKCTLNSKPFPIHR